MHLQATVGFFTLIKWTELTPEAVGLAIVCTLSDAFHFDNWSTRCDWCVWACPAFKHRLLLHYCHFLSSSTRSCWVLSCLPWRAHLVQQPVLIGGWLARSARRLSTRTDSRRCRGWPRSLSGSHCTDGDCSVALRAHFQACSCVGRY